MKKFIFILLIAISCFILMQFIQPNITHPPVTKNIEAPPEVVQVLKKSCYDCHSNETRLSWFDKVSPASFIIADHIRQARHAFNFSEWDKKSISEQETIMVNAINRIIAEEMPLPSYLFFHPEARVKKSEIDMLKSYFKSLVPERISDSSQVRIANQQYRNWIAGNLPAQKGEIRAAPNGLLYMKGYKKWGLVNISDRFDNGQMRVVLGNDVAMNAIRDNQTNPWPDGTILAKLAWEQLTDSNFQVQTGTFKQVLFMVKDHETFANTAGWGWGRWKNDDLEPDGESASFTSACISCHRPMANNDFVFTKSLTPQQKAVEGQQLIGFVMDKEQHTMSVLFGNDIAVMHSRNGGDEHYPEGAAISLVTWKQQEDGHWFGSRTPGESQSVETLRFTPQPAYAYYKGSNLQVLPSFSAEYLASRIQYIAKIRASVILH